MSGEFPKTEESDKETHFTYTVYCCYGMRLRNADICKGVDVKGKILTYLIKKIEKHLKSQLRKSESWPKVHTGNKYMTNYAGCEDIRTDQGR